MPATGLQVNWVDVAFGTTAIDRVTNIAFGMNATNIGFKGDAAVYEQVVVNVDNSPTATVTSGNAGLLMGLPVNAAGVFTATHKDALGETGGDIVYEMDSILISVETSGAHAQFGSATGSLKGVSPDGVTNPLSFTRA
ncbi:hypothetical protein [Paludisphaera soli]|uniref:hypothetical protein n=1 Tax=Paludisphaera soli TaxID=2712865 RepID=UPI0013ECA8C7|nr:hypothetical protein [Paludisphaera soli]